MQVFGCRCVNQDTVRLYFVFLTLPGSEHSVTHSGCHVMPKFWAMKCQADGVE